MTEILYLQIILLQFVMKEMFLFEKLTKSAKKLFNILYYIPEIPSSVLPLSDSL